MFQHVPPHLLDHHPSQAIPELDGLSDRLGIEWSPSLDCFCLTIVKLLPQEAVLGGFVCVIVKVLQ